jgi:hypothetical protein
VDARHKSGYDGYGLRRARGFSQQVRGNPEIIDEALIFPRLSEVQCRQVALGSFDPIGIAHEKHNL